MSPASPPINTLAKARTLCTQTKISVPLNSSPGTPLSNPAAIFSRGARRISTEAASKSTPNEAILRRRRHQPSFPQPKATPNATRFVISTKSEYHGQTEIERHFHGALTCLHRILGDVPYGRTQGPVSRTPIQILPRTDADCRGSTLAFKVFNANGELRERIAKELRGVEGVDGVVCEEGCGN